MDATTLLAPRAKPARRPVYVLFGDEPFLRRRAREKLIAAALGDADPELAAAVYDGDDITLPTLRNELDTLPFLAPCRVVVVEDADDFISDNREALEAYVGKPSSRGVLILECRSFPETTRLARALPDEAKVACKALHPARLAGWCVSWAKSTYKKELAADGAELLVSLVGQSMGMLDQELAKLATAVGDGPPITAADVDRLAPRSASANVFRILDAIGEGQPAVALSILEELFADGEDPMAILAAITVQLRKLATVGRLVAGGMPMGMAMDAAQVMKWEGVRINFERQLRHLGRRRLEKLPDWLTEINLGLKGGSPLPERVQVERLVVLLARPREEPRK